MQIIKNKASIRSVEDWFLHAPPKGKDGHWEPGRSALECARAWCGGDQGPCVPQEITALLNSHPDTRDAEMVSGTPEHRVRFDKLRGEPRNTDLVLLARNKQGSLAISIEAKADEPFDRAVQEIVADTIDDLAHGSRSKVNTRIQSLAESLLPPRQNGAPRLGDLRYQLLTAAAGALAYAADEGADRAVVIIHEFVADRTTDDNHKTNTHDLNAFLKRLTNGAHKEVTERKLIGPLVVPGTPLFASPVPLYIGKATRTLRTPIA
jgi:hypothetical protein